ncbi:worker-enriched antennal transcript isoform X1 [Cotesia typhae]|uniref:worker-enriched antennal transcript isoform X1 n=1 Tax=Cotesia typhae TaxID=2053667 RepID=UPI003D684BBC
MRLTGIFAVIMTVLASAMGIPYDYNSFFSDFGPYYRAVTPMRDPRSNTGPVLFPRGPEPDRVETSGVIVGASGFGFVPPNSGKGININGR